MKVGLWGTNLGYMVALRMYLVVCGSQALGRNTSKQLALPRGFN